MRLEIDYDNLIVTKETVIDRVVYTLDNFFKFPNIVSNHLNKLEMPPSPDAYPGNQLFYPTDENSEFGKHMGEVKQILKDHGFGNNRFINCETDGVWSSKLVTEYARNKAIQPLGCMNHVKVMCNPHTDVDCEMKYNVLAGVCYLSKKSIHGGTGLFRVKKTGFYASDKRWYLKLLSDLSKKMAGVSCEIEREKIRLDHNLEVMSDRFPKQTGYINESDDYFERVHFFPMKFNRVIFYEGDLLHSMIIEDEQFYNTNDRITMNYGFNIDWGASAEQLEQIEQHISILQ
jgi:hypothetical protein